MAQQIKISLVADNQTQPAQRGVDALEKKIEELEKEWKKAGEAAKKSGGEMQASSQKAATATKGAGSSISGLGSIAKSAAGPLIALFAVDRIAEFGKQIISVRSEFQKYEAVLTNTFGSNTKAVAVMAQLQEQATKLPYSLAELTGAYVKMVNNGINPSSEEMTAFADLASNAGKGIDQLAEAVNDATRGEFERLKEFFIDASKQGDKIIFTFKGQKVAVDNNAVAIKNYLVQAGKIPGVMGASEAITKTLSGQIGNLGDSWDNFLNILGNQSEGPFSKVIGFLSSLISKVSEAIKSQDQINKEKSVKMADEYIQSFEKMNQYQQRNEEALLATRLARQKVALEQEVKLREENFAKIGDVMAGDSEDYKNQKEKDLEFDIKFNAARLDLIKHYYAEKQKEEEKNKPAELSEDQLKKLAEAREKLFKERMRELDELEKLAIREAELADKSQTQIHLIELAFNEERLKTLRNFGKKATNEYKSYTLEQKEIIKENEKELREIILRSHDKRYKDQQDFNKIMKSAQDKSIDDLVAKEEWAAEQRDKLKREEAERKKQIEEESYNVSVQFMDALFQIGRDRNAAALADNDARRQEELKRVGDDAQAKAFINAKFDRENAKLKQKQAVADKANALFGIAINTAMAIVKQLATTPLPVGAPLVALIAASGAIQAALVASRPIPKYKEGTDFVRRLHGEPMGRDTILAHIDEGERIVPREINRQLTGIKNSELPRLARVAKEEKIMVAEFRELVAQQRETNRTLKNLKLYRTDLTEQGIVHTVESNNARTKILNEQFSL